MEINTVESLLDLFDWLDFLKMYNLKMDQEIDRVEMVNYYKC